MAHINLNNQAPGILGLMAYKPTTATALNQLAETILRGPSPLSQGERELIAGVVSFLNECQFCHRSHAAVADYCLDKPKGYCKSVAQNIEGSDVSEKMKSLLKIASIVQKSGRNVSKSDIDFALSNGAVEEEIHDTIMIAAAFCMFNRYVDGLGTFAPEENNIHYEKTAERLSKLGYMATKPQ